MAQRQTIKLKKGKSPEEGFEVIGYTDDEDPIIKTPEGKRVVNKKDVKSFIMWNESWEDLL